MICSKLNPFLRLYIIKIVSQTQSVDTKDKGINKYISFIKLNPVKTWAHKRGIKDLKPYTTVEITLTPCGKNISAADNKGFDSKKWDWIGNKILSVIKKQIK